MYGDFIHPYITQSTVGSMGDHYGTFEMRIACARATSHSRLQTPAAHIPPTRLCAADVRAREIEVLELDGCTPCNTRCQRSSSAQRSVRMDALEETRNAIEPALL